MRERKIKQADQLQHERREKLQLESEIAVTELNQKIQRLTEDMALLVERVKTLEES